jgi:hypothetical protein
VSVTIKSVGQFVTSTTTDPSPAAVNGPAAGDRSLMFVAFKPITATMPTPENWTLVAGPIDGGTGSQGADTGPSRLWVFQRDGEFSGAQAIEDTGGNSGYAIIITFSKTLDAWADVATTTGDDTTGGGATYSATYAANPGITADDALVAAIAIPTDASTLTVQGNLASPSLTATGISGGTQASRYGETGTGFDFGAGLIWLDEFTGTASAAPTVSAQFTSATNTYGPTILARLRDEAAGVDGTADVVLPALASSSTGTVDVDGTAATALPALAASLSGTVSVPVDGTTDVVLPALASSNTGTVDVAGTAAAALPALAASLSGTVEAAATTDVALPALTASLEGAVEIDGVAGTANVVLPALASSSAGAVDVDGTAAAALPALTASLEGTVEIVEAAAPIDTQLWNWMRHMGWL